MGFGGCGKCNWENADVGSSLSLTPFKQRRLDLQCGGAHPPACHSHTHTRTDIPGESVAQLINFRSVTCVVVVALSRSSKPHLHLLFARVKKRFLSLVYTHSRSSQDQRQGAKSRDKTLSLPLACAFLCLFGISTGLAYVHWLFVIAETAADNVTRGRISFWSDRDAT